MGGEANRCAELADLLVELLLGAVRVGLQVIDDRAECLVDCERNELGDCRIDGVANRGDDDLLKVLLLPLMDSLRRGREGCVQRLALVREVLRQLTLPARRCRRARVVVMLQWSVVENFGCEYQLLTTG